MSIVIEYLGPQTLAGLRAPTGSNAEWDRFVAAHPRSEHYHLRLWKRVGERAYGLRAPYLLARDTSRQVRGVLPLFLVKRPFGSYLTGGLFGAYGPLLADDEARPVLLDEAQRIARAGAAQHIILKSLGADPPPPGYEVRDTTVIATLPLDPEPGGAERVHKKFSNSVRWAIRKAQRSGFVTSDDAGHLDGFYDVLAENMHRKGTPIYGVAFFRELLAALAAHDGGGYLITLSLEGRVVSGAIVAYHRDRVYVPFASSRPATFSLKPNNLLYWEIMQRAMARGARVLDFGRSPRDSTTLEFKLTFGATVTPQPFHILPLRGAAPAMDPNDPGLQRLIALWQRLPRGLADVLGPSICAVGLI